MSQVNFAALEHLAHNARAQAGLTLLEPIPEIVGILEHLGLLVLVRPLGPDGPGGIYVRRPRFAAVLLNGSDYLPRFRFSGGHELGHHVRGHYESHVDYDFRGDDPREREANAFSASFLVPRPAVYERVGRLSRDITPMDARDLASEFIVSYEFLVNRLHNVGLLKGANHRDQLKAARALVLTDDLRERFPATRWRLPVAYMRRALDAYGRYDISLDRLAELLGREPQELAPRLAEQQFLHPEDAA
jgi:Zn-dependent peptidase ImmA (M78 family)